MQRYFRLRDDVELAGRWQLSEPLDRSGFPLADPWQFSAGNKVQLQERSRFRVDVAGAPLDFSETAFHIPIVHVKVASLLTDIASEDIQLIPVDVDSHPDEYSLLIATRLIRCIDDQASEEVEYWTPEDGRPEMVGQYRGIFGMRIDSAKVGPAQVFRTWGWEVALIVSEQVKRAMESVGATGTRFIEV